MTAQPSGFKLKNAALAGRMDVIEELEPADVRQVQQMFEYYYWHLAPDELELTHGPDDRISQAAVAEIFKRHLDDPAGAIKELEKEWER